MVESARPWFDGLKPRSITSYDDLCDKFLLAFSSLRKGKMTLLELQEVKQGINEKLSTYLTRFSRAAREVDTTSDDGILMALYNGLKHTDIWNHLKKYPVKKFDEDLVVAEPFIRPSDTPGETRLLPAPIEKRSRLAPQDERHRYREHFKRQRTNVIKAEPKKKVRFNSYKKLT